MEILFVLVPVSLVIVLIALGAFVWSVHNQQYEDLDKEAERILFDDQHFGGSQKEEAVLKESVLKESGKPKLNEDNL